MPYFCQTVLVYDGNDAGGRWTVSALPVGQTLRPPEQLIKKLPPETVEEERGRLGLDGD